MALWIPIGWRHLDRYCFTYGRHCLGGKPAKNLRDSCSKHKPMMWRLLIQTYLRSVPISWGEAQEWHLLQTVNPQSACTVRHLVAAELQRAHQLTRK